jgi:hypothetical protein
MNRTTAFPTVTLVLASMNAAGGSGNGWRLTLGIARPDSPPA